MVVLGGRLGTTNSCLLAFSSCKLQDSTSTYAGNTQQLTTYFKITPFGYKGGSQRKTATISWKLTVK